MDIIQHKLSIRTKGSGDLLDITPDITQLLHSSGLKDGNMTVFVVGSTAGLTTFEYEPGLIEDVRSFYQKLIPDNKRYSHDKTWGDANGFSHLRAALTGQSLTIPFENSKLLLGTWQQVVLAEFDTRPRQRQVVVQMIGR